jgi:hypothetical protein
VEPEPVYFAEPTPTSINLSTPPQFFPFEEIQVPTPFVQEYVFDEFVQSGFNVENQRPQWDNGENASDFFDEFMYYGGELGI